MAQSAKDLKEGDFVVARGKLRTDSWDDKNNPGKKVYKLVVQVDQLILADGQSSDGDDANIPEAVGAGSGGGKVKQEEMPW